MRIVRTLGELAQILTPARQGALPIALVPTMGYFHGGHLSLMEAARRGAGTVVVSLFVNPAQFGPGEDLAHYPRDEVRDEELASRGGADVLFAPTVEEMYPGGRVTWVEVPEMAGYLCGGTRPFHFRGVATVVAKLFNLVRPDVAYFGAKDYQQTVLIRRLVADLNFPVEVRVLPTVREADGLAMSSRNAYLSPEERREARLIPAALEAGRLAWEKGGVPQEVKEAARSVLAGSPLLRPDYVSVVDPESLEDLAAFGAEGRSALLALAVYAGKTRLIDNVLLGKTL